MLKLEEESDKMEEEKRVSPFPFLDAETFAALEQEVLPQLITQARLDHQTLRVWVVECSSGEVLTTITLLLAQLLGNALASFRIQIFATDRDETRLAYAYRGIFERNSFLPSQALEVARFCEPVGDQYRLCPLLRKLAIFGKHDLWHDPFFANLDLILCGFSLLDHPINRQQQFLSQVSKALTRSGRIVFSRQDSAILAHFPYQTVGEGISIYHYAPAGEEPDPLMFAEEHVGAQQSPDLAVDIMSRLLHTPPVDIEVSGEKGAPASIPVALDVLLQLAPIGIVVIDHCYQMLSFNRAARKLLTPQIHEGRHVDFFHAIAGLPYIQVRTAIDTVMQEGTSQTLEEVELAISAGGNGRVLCMEICLMPTEIGTSSRLVLYLQDVTMETAQKKSWLQQTQTIKEAFTNNAHLIQKCSNLERTDERLREVSSRLLTNYQYLATQLEAMQETCSLQDQEVEQLLEEIAVLTEDRDRETSTT